MFNDGNSISWHPITRDLLFAKAEYLARLDECSNVVALRNAARHFRDLQMQRAVLARQLIARSG